eukprot:m.615138 g.615138  ORF g.615138 m.615138 type:complete len:207 (-) comp58160_c0_seq5:32-652(-)
MGVSGYTRLLKERKENYDYLKSKLEAFAKGHGERLLETKHNPISLGMTLTSLAAGTQTSPKDISFLGSILFTKCISGTRVIVSSGETTQVAGVPFRSYGAHIDHYPVPYLTAAAAIGMTQHDVDVFIDRLGKAFKQFFSHRKRAQMPTTPGQPQLDLSAADEEADTTAAASATATTTTSALPATQEATTEAASTIQAEPTDSEDED